MFQRPNIRRSRHCIFYSTIRNNFSRKKVQCKRNNLYENTALFNWSGWLCIIDVNACAVIGRRISIWIDHISPFVHRWKRYYVSEHQVPPHISAYIYFLFVAAHVNDTLRIENTKKRSISTTVTKHVMFRQCFKRFLSTKTSDTVPVVSYFRYKIIHRWV